MSGLSGQKEGREKTRDVLKLAVSACLSCHVAGRGCPLQESCQPHLKHTLGMPWPGTQQGEVQGLGWGLERLALQGGGGRKQQISSRGRLKSNLMLVDGAVWGPGLAMGFSKP